MPKQAKIIMMTLVIMIVIGVVILVATDKPRYLIVDGWHNEAYAGAINTIFQKGLNGVSNEIAHLASAYLEDMEVDYIVLINPPTVKIVLDFYNLAKAHGAKLIIGEASNEQKLKAELFNSTLSNKQIIFKTDREWKPDWQNSFY